QPAPGIYGSYASCSAEAAAKACAVFFKNNIVDARARSGKCKRQGGIQPSPGIAEELVGAIGQSAKAKLPEAVRKRKANGRAGRIGEQQQTSFQWLARAGIDAGCCHPPACSGIAAGTYHGNQVNAGGRGYREVAG